MGLKTHDPGILVFIIEQLLYVIDTIFGAMGFKIGVYTGWRDGVNG